MTWGEAQRRYLDWLRGRGLAASTLVKRERSLKRLAAFGQAQGAWRPQELTAGHLATYRRQLVWTVGPRHRLPSMSTIAGHLAAARGFARYLVAEGHLLVDPTGDLVIPYPPPALPRLLSVEEAQRLLDAPDPRSALGLRDRAILEMLYGLGLRRGECCQLDLVDYDRPQRTLLLRRTKNRQERRLPVGPCLHEALETYLTRGRPALARFPEEPSLFLSRRTGRRLSAVRLEQMVLSRAQAVGLRGVRPHALRHACATHLLAGGADVRHIQALLGHEALTSTEHYLHLQPLELFAEHARTHPRARQDSASPPQKSP